MTNDSELDKILIFLMQSDIKVGESIINHPSMIEATQAIHKELIKARIEQTELGKQAVKSMDSDCQSLQLFDYEIKRLEAELNE